MGASPTIFGIVAIEAEDLILRGEPRLDDLSIDAHPSQSEGVLASPTVYVMERKEYILCFPTTGASTTVSV